ncbi:MAG: dTDP-glucose 4,6-dehydratase [Planctomycetes bacterium]|nr:dTDP-glucose 4,6-dehydratase [Planctomycetota bacterium]
MNLLVTGGAGFIGSNFIRYILGAYPGYRVVNLDRLTYAGNLENLRDVEAHPGYEFVRGDIANTELVDILIQQKQIEGIVNFAAESHVDRSILGASDFIRTNVQGALTLLEVARTRSVPRFLQVSTDEVYGSLGPAGAFTENSPLQPHNPYSASKAAADLLVGAFHHTFGLTVCVSRCSNNYGPYQFPEKMIPLMITNALEGKPLPVYGDGLHVRDWIHVADHASALDRILHLGRPGEVYNIGAGNERTNIDLVRLLVRLVGVSESLITRVKDRPGHDRRYAIDASKLRSEMGWSPARDFEAGLAETVEWYRTHAAWWKRIKDGEYRHYYERFYQKERGIS